MTPQGQAGAPAQQPGWFSRNWKWVVALGCVLPVMCCGVFGVGTYFMVSKVIQGTPVFAEALEKANTNPEVTAALGQPVTPGFMLSGEVKESGGKGTAHFTIPIEGPKGKGSLAVDATQSGGQWSFDSLKADVGGRTVDLLAGQPPPAVNEKAPPPEERAAPPPAENEDDAPPPEGDDPD